MGLDEYLDEAYALSVFDQVIESKDRWEFHLHGEKIVQARILENMIYDVKIEMEGKGEEELPKIQIKFLYPAELSDTVRKLLKTDKKIKALHLEPIFSPHKRFFVKNKSLFPLMKEKQVLFFKMLEGEIVRGVVTAFSRYEITIHLKGGIPVTIMRYAIYDLRNKKGRCFLKSFQEEHRDWENSELFVKEQKS